VIHDPMPMIGMASPDDGIARVIRGPGAAAKAGGMRATAAPAASEHRKLRLSMNSRCRFAVNFDLLSLPRRTWRGLRQNGRAVQSLMRQCGREYFALQRKIDYRPAAPDRHRLISFGIRTATRFGLAV